MKKRIAIFANGWSNEYLNMVLNGVQRRAKKDNVDLFAFVNYSAGDEQKEDNIGESKIFRLPDLREFDGVMLMGNTLNLRSEREYLYGEIMKYNIPAACLENEMMGIPYLGTDTYSGVYELVSHLVEEHGVRDVVFISGPTDNVESQTRLNATRDALARVDQILPDSNVICGEWSYYVTYEIIMKWVNENSKLPDAFICANDEMAIGAISALDMLGIKVPEQVLVSGCDHIEKGQTLYPILSTVARKWEKLGYNGLDLLLREMDGETVPLKTVYSSVPVIGESCGCHVCEERKESRRQAIIGAYRAKNQSSMNEWHLRHIDDLLTKMTSVGQMKDSLGWNFSYNHSFEGADFMICLVEEWYNLDREIPADSNGYTDKMEIYVRLHKGKSQRDIMFFEKKDLIPIYDGETEESHIHLFIPLHIDKETLGYAVFIDELKSLFDQTIYTWARHVSQDLLRARQNIMLEELNRRLMDVSITDALTGLKNRGGYDALAFPCLQKCHREGKYGAMIFADVNRMKMINDKFGHLQGDVALCTVADAIKMTLPEGWIAVRYGGDEFIMVGECKDEQEAEEIKEKLALNLEELKKERDLAFPLTASLGAVVMHPDENYTLEEYLRKADQAMYIMKKRYHEGD